MDSLYQSATAMFPINPDVWPRNNITWLAQRCAFLIGLRHSRNEYFHGMDARNGFDFNEEIERISNSSFIPELQQFMNEFPDLYNELWYDISFEN